MKKIIYIVILDGSYDHDPDTKVLGAFAHMEGAVACLQKKANEIRNYWDEDEIQEDSETRFHASQIGCYNENHETLYIHEEELR